MREIKFRAWDYTSNVMRNDITEMVFNSDGTLNQINVETGADILFPEKECVLMQYTGLKDKNGVEIYEGDIVQYSTFYYGNKQERKKVVEWIDDMQDDSFGEPLSMGYRFYGSEIEVIGNIYENPELLEEKLL